MLNFTQNCAFVIHLRFSKTIYWLKIWSWCLSAPGEGCSKGKLAKWHSAACPLLLDWYPYLCFFLPFCQRSLFFLFVCFFVIFPVACCSQRRLARLAVCPFWGWNCTGGRPSVHCNTAYYSITFYENPQQVELAHCLQADLILYLRWWGCVQVGYRLQCGPAGAAGKSSGASELPRGPPWCSHKPRSHLLEKRALWGKIYVWWFWILA